MSNKLIQRVEYKRSNTTPGPWGSHLTLIDQDENTGMVDADLQIVSESNGQKILSCRFLGNPADAAFLADAYGLVDELLDEIERLERRNQRLESMLPEMPAGFLPPEPDR